MLTLGSLEFLPPNFGQQRPQPSCNSTVIVKKALMTTVKLVSILDPTHSPARSSPSSSSSTSFTSNSLQSSTLPLYDTSYTCKFI